MDGSGNKTEDKKRVMLCLCGVLVCSAILVLASVSVFSGGNELLIGGGMVPPQQSDTAAADGLSVDTSEGISAVISDADISEGVPSAVTDALFSGVKWAPGTRYTKSLAVCNCGTSDLEYDISLFVIGSEESFIVPDDFDLSVSGDHVLNSTLADADGTVVARSDSPLGAGLVRSFDISIAYSGNTDLGYDVFSVCLILAARDSFGNTVCSVTGDRLDHVPDVVSSGTVLLQDDTMYTLRMQSDRIVSGLTFSGGDSGSVLILDDGYADDGLVVYMKDCLFKGVDLSLPVACVFENCGFRTAEYMNISAEVLAHFNLCVFDSGVVIYVPNQETVSFLEFSECENEPVIVKR